MASNYIAADNDQRSERLQKNIRRARTAVHFVYIYLGLVTSIAAAHVATLAASGVVVIAAKALSSTLVTCNNQLQLIL